MRFVIKLGSMLVTQEDATLDVELLSRVCGEVAELHEAGHDVIIVTSGAVASGRKEIKFEKENKTLPWKRVLAAVGQGMLIREYHEQFAPHGIKVAQALLKRDDFFRRDSFLNTQHVFDLLLKHRIVPVVNENDVTAISEMTLGDNDMLSAKTAIMCGADLLLILTTVDGLYTEPPHSHPNAKRILRVEKIDELIRNVAQDTTSRASVGGMKSKIDAAAHASEMGIPVIVAHGRTKGIVSAVIREFIANKSNPSGGTYDGTYFAAQGTQLESFKRWISAKKKKDARIIIDSGAVGAVRERGKSLLPSGMVRVEGEFERGDVVHVVGENGEEVGFGQVNYSSKEAEKIARAKSSEIEARLGYMYEDEMMHRDFMVVA